MTLFKRITATVAFTLVLASSAYAVQGNEVGFMGGTVTSVPIGAVGTLDLSSTTAMVFRTSGAEIQIPYAGMTEVQTRTEVARHLGVLPAVAVGLVRKRERRHYITLMFEDAGQVKQAVIFEVPKTRTVEILATLLARAPAACGKTGYACRPRPEY